MEIVSAIITTHNRKELLKRAIDSVFKQTYPNIEIIVIDDASTDGTSEICKDSRIKYIYIQKEESRGGNYARNLGVKVSKGKYCAFLDDDDYWLPTKIEKQVQLIESNDCELVFTGKRNEIVSVSSISYVDYLPTPQKCGNMKNRIFYTIPSSTSFLLIEKKALLDIGLFDEKLKFWQEYELMIRLAQRKPFLAVEEILGIYRVDIHDNNRLTNKYYEWKKAVKYIRCQHKQLYDNLSLKEKYFVWMHINNDAKLRSKNCGLKMQYQYYRLLSFIDSKVIHKLFHK